MKKTNINKIYKKLRKIYTDKEIADSFVFSEDMTDEESKELSEYLKKHRKEKNV